MTVGKRLNGEEFEQAGASRQVRFLSNALSRAREAPAFPPAPSGDIELSHAAATRYAQATAVGNLT